MVAHLQHVDRADLAARDERGLDRHLRIAGEQCAEPAVSKLDHHRAVVDVPVGHGSGRVGGRGVQHPDRRGCVECQHHARAGHGHRDAVRGSLGHEPLE